MQKEIRFILVLTLVFLTLVFGFSACTSDDDIVESSDDTVTEEVEDTDTSDSDESDGDSEDTEDTEDTDTSDSEDDSDSSSSIVEEDDDTASDVVGTYDYSTLKSLGHPRLLMSSDDFADLKTKVTTGRFSNKTLYKIHKLLIDLADEYAADETEVTYTFDSSNKRILEQSRIALKRMFTCSYAYQLTGKAKYLTRATQDLETVCNFTNWNASKHFLDAGEMCLGVAIAYDWLYYNLSYEDRVLAHSAMLKFAMSPSIGNSYHSQISNWNQVCNCGVVAAAITLYEKEKTISANVIEAALTSNATAMAGIYTPDGNYPEGYDYWGYGTGFEVIMLAMLEKAFGDTNGLTEIEGFDKTANYMLYMAGTQGCTFSYADGGVSSERPNPGMWYFAAKQNDASLLLNEWRLYNADDYTGYDADRLLASIPCFIKDVNFDDVSSAVPSSDIWYGEGSVPVVMVHTGWNYDSDDYYFGFKGGAANDAHGHMDAGSFVYDSQGVRWSYDLIRPSYSTVETAMTNAGGSFWTLTQKSLRWECYKMNNLAHSTLTFENTDGSVSKTYDTDHVVKGSATLEEVYESGDLGAKMDLSAVFSDQASSVYRTVKLVDGKDLYVIDEVTAKSGMDALMQWRMMTPATVSVGDDKLTLTQSSKTLYIEASNDQSIDITYTSWTASAPDEWTSRSWNSKVSGYTVAGYTATIPAGTTATFTTVLTATE